MPTKPPIGPVARFFATDDPPCGAFRLRWAAGLTGILLGEPRGRPRPRGCACAIPQWSVSGNSTGRGEVPMAPPPSPAVAAKNKSENIYIFGSRCTVARDALLTWGWSRRFFLGLALLENPLVLQLDLLQLQRARFRFESNAELKRTKEMGVIWCDALARGAASPVSPFERLIVFSADPEPAPSVRPSTPYASCRAA
eukprot:SAG31_NODE_1638_length_7672_cov_4.225142_6_plen_197_part_00